MSLFQKRLKALRIKRQLSTKELAEYLGIKIRAYQFYESGDRYPEFFGLLALADFYQVSLDYLVGRSDYEQIVQPRQKSYQEEDKP